MMPREICTLVVGGAVLNDGTIIRVTVRGVVIGERVIVREGPEFRFEEIVFALVERLVQQRARSMCSGLYRARAVIQ